VSVDYHLTFWKSEIVDAVMLQQDAFDAIDARTPARSGSTTWSDWCWQVMRHRYAFDSFEEVQPFFKLSDQAAADELLCLSEFSRRLPRRD
jgi:V/A-type H+-transporting ATPase subunit A